MADEKKQAYTEKYKAQIAEWEADIDKLKAKAAGASADARIEYEEQLEALKQKTADQRRKLDELQEAGEESVDELSKGFDAAWQELTSTWENIKAKLS